MAKRNIKDMFDDLEDFIESCKSQKLSSNKIVVSRDVLLNYIREIEMKIPSEVEHSNKIVENREVILAEARRQSEAIIAEANAEAQRRVNDTEIMNMATEQAKALIAQAQANARAIENQANDDANVLRFSALNYTNNIMSDLAGFTAQIIEEQQKSFQDVLTTLSNQYQTIETNRQQIASQLESNEAPAGDGSDSIKRENMSDVERMHYETRAANSVKKAKSTVQQSQSFAQPSQTVNVERAHPEVKVQSVST
ncbi:MAG: hypothetical protein K5656_04045, partial [Lachnospiraceae bacterium]|nr:hypothetical protein [Lachnospiraceae bacterium]